MPRKTRKPVDYRHKDVDWHLPAAPEADGDGELDPAFVQCALLMDLRDELKETNRLLARMVRQREQ